MGASIHESDARSGKITPIEHLAYDTDEKALFKTNDLNAAMQKAIANGSHDSTIACTRQ